MTTLLSRTLLGLGKTASLTAFKSAVDLSATLALIRILRVPEPWGELIFVFVWLELFHRLSNYGGHLYLIQRKGLTRDDLRTAMTLEVTSALFWAGVWWFAAPVFFTSLGRENLVTGALILTPWLAFERIGLPARAMLEREMRFGRSNGALLLGTLALAIVSIALALAGWGVTAIFVGKVAQSAVSTVSLWLFQGRPPRPGISGKSLRPLLRFGLPLLPADLMQFYHWNAPYVIIGLVMRDDAVLGLYYLAFKLPHYMLQLQDLVSRVVYPAFTKAANDERLLAGFQMATKYSAAVALLPVALVVALGEGVPRHVLLEAYVPATSALIVFTALAAYRMITAHWYAAYLAKGRTIALPLLTGLNAVGVTIGATVGIPWGILGVALGVAIPSAAVTLLAIQGFLRRVLPVQYLPALRTPLITALIAGAVGAVARAAGLDVAHSADAFWAVVAAMTLVYVGVGIGLDRRELRRLAASLRGE